MHVSPAKYSDVQLPRKCDNPTDAGYLCVTTLYYNQKYSKSNTVNLTLLVANIDPCNNMNNKRCMLKSTKILVPEPKCYLKCWQSSVHDLDFWAPKSIGIFLSSSWKCVWNMKAVYWKLPKLSCQNHESCILKTTQVIVSEPKCWRING